MKLPKVVADLVRSFERLPGVGSKTAQRLAFYLLRVPQRDLDLFSKSLADLKKKTKLCKTCHNLSEVDVCVVCDDSSRDHAQVCVVETFSDVIAFEKSGGYSGIYHVLHGSISPLNNVGPDELFIDDLLARIQSGRISEIVLATSTSLEGDATAMYIANQVRDVKQRDGELSALKLTRIGRGLPTGVEIEYADDDTLNQAFKGRTQLYE